MRVYKEKCDECGKIIEGVSAKEVRAWLNQHIHYAHKKQTTED